MTPGLPREVLAAKRLLARALAADPGVVGVGVEADERGRPVLVVIVEEGRADPGRVPAEIGGVPVTVRVGSAARKR